MFNHILSILSCGFLILFLRSVLSLLNILLKTHYATLSGPRWSYPIHAVFLQAVCYFICDKCVICVPQAVKSLVKVSDWTVTHAVPCLALGWHWFDLFSLGIDAQPVKSPSEFIIQPYFVRDRFCIQGCGVDEGGIPALEGAPTRPDCLQSPNFGSVISSASSLSTW